MKTHTTRTLALASLAGAAILNASTASAALAYSDGDLLLGFRSTGGAGATTDYLVNAGNISTFLSATTVVNLSLGNLDADLDSIFGSSWDTRADFVWSASGALTTAALGLTNRTIFATQGQGTPLGGLGFANSIPWNRASLTSQNGTVSGKFQPFTARFAQGSASAGQIESANSPFALIQPDSGPNSLSSYMPFGVNTGTPPNSAAFGVFNDSDGIEDSFGNGAAGTALDLYVMQSGSGAGTYEGTFTIDSSAAITFTPAGVPEPSSMLMLSIGAAAITCVRRRRNA